MIINFKYWLEKNIVDSDSIYPHRAMITRIENLYKQNNENNQVYFCGNQIEIERLKALSLLGLEEEILTLIRSTVSHTDLDILKIFDLIQIWGGLTGGSNPYKPNGSKKIHTQRADYKNWLPTYKQLIRLAQLRDYHSAYGMLRTGLLPSLKMSFGSKHISFWSRTNGDNSSLIVIDNKIAGVFGYRKAIDVQVDEVINRVLEIQNITGFTSQQIEKAWFSFHKTYFDNSNSKFNKERQESEDLTAALELAHVLGIHV